MSALVMSMLRSPHSCRARSRNVGTLDTVDRDLVPCGTGVGPRRHVNPDQHPLVAPLRACERGLRAHSVVASEWTEDLGPFVPCC